jgi:hypothetical protein
MISTSFGIYASLPEEEEEEAEDDEGQDIN